MRNTDQTNLLFPIREEKVHLYRIEKPIPGFKAIVGDLGGGFSTTFSIVSDNYQLVTNSTAIELGKKIHLRLFPNANANSFEIFNILTPKTRSFCHIDIIDKNYKVNIWKSEVYVPFIRIHNSYNRSRSLKFDIGFCRKLCDNGVIYEQNTIQLKFAHTKQAIDFDKILNIDVSHLQKLEADFIVKTKRSAEIEVPKKYFIPLAAKILNRNFDISAKEPERAKNAKIKMNRFANFIVEYAEKYSNFGETAYSLFNILTDYVSNSQELQTGAINGMQTKCGLWINEIGKSTSVPGFSWDEEIKDYRYLLN